MNCDHIAAWYATAERLSFGAELQRRRCHYLPELAGARKVLMAGEGDGRFLTEYAKRNPEAEIDYVDSSERMLTLASKRTNGNARFHRADILRDEVPGSGYDLIVTHFFLDCFAEGELATMVERLAAHCSPDAKWAISEFRVPSSGWQRWRAKLWIRSLYLAFGIVTGLKVRRLPDYPRALWDAGFELEREDLASGGLLTSELWRRKADPSPTHVGS
jgi:ubiquinone/menaquinone biosynthesis C-methylase UbiE